MSPSPSYPQSDPGDQQPTLFTAPPAQPKCTRGCKHKNLCEHDGDLEHGTLLAGKRPRSCLNSAQLTADQPLPF